MASAVTFAVAFGSGFALAACVVNFTITNVFIFIMAWEQVGFELKVWCIVLVIDLVGRVILKAVLMLRRVIQQVVTLNNLC